MWERILIALLVRAGELAWKLLSNAEKDRLASDRIRAHVQRVMTEYESLILKYDEISDSGSMSSEQKDQLRKDKIRLEEDLINGAYPRP